MLNLGVPGLVAAYVALAVLLLSLHLYSNWSWWVKGAATLLLAGFYFVTYSSFPQLLGWPTPYDPPKRLYLIGIDIAEPDYVYLWARDLDQGLGLTTPRAYRLPYSKLLHREAEEAGHKLRKRIPVIGEIDALPNAGLTAADGEATTVKTPSVRFVDAPEGLVPLKD